MPKASRDHGPSDRLTDPDQTPEALAEQAQAQQDAAVDQADLADANPHDVRVTGDGLAHDLTAAPPGEDVLAGGQVVSPANPDEFQGYPEQDQADGDNEDDGGTVRLPSSSANKGEWEDHLVADGVSAEWVHSEGRTKDDLVRLGRQLRDGEVELDDDGNPPSDEQA